jgi:hypothetical protein
MGLRERQLLQSGVSLHFCLVLNRLELIDDIDDLYQIPEALVHYGLKEHDIVVLQYQH